ncbi:lactonase family protein [Lactobacillus sp. YT155]|uniref:lactonase family protein n=1 Tax=Lactobacillus sp. YT155 TaxID=3060955 RepID=UPI00265FB474|nr:lactonase family protein [Lactobacillus sp. YT155]MDO1605148.1 lactonase family protein [Lactobacillus sp. YT155]
MKEQIYLSGYTNKGKGIYSASLDTETKTVSTPQVFVEIDRPTYIDVANNNHLYAIQEKGDWGGIAAFDLNGSKPEYLNSALKLGSAPSYVQYDPTRNMVYSCQFHGSKVYVDKVQEDGTLKSLYTINLTGSGPKPEQDSSKPHFSGLTPDNKLIICDYGADTVSIYDLSDTQVPTLLSQYHAKAGSATRHLVFHPTKNIAYVICELSSEILVMDYDETTHELSLRQTISTLPDDFSADDNTAAAIRISNDGKFLYASNRGSDTLAIYQIAESGEELTNIAYQPVAGKGPRDFDLDPSNNFLLVANQNTDNLSLFERNTDTGLLSLIKDDIAIPECVCVKFI